MQIDYRHLESLIPLRENIKVQELPKALRLLKSKTMECWYAPLGPINRNAKIAFYGITPGQRQMIKAYQIFVKNHSLGHAKESLSKIAFYGSMRTNLIAMLDEIGLAKKMEVDSMESLFGTNKLAYSSVLKYPVFVNGKNYNGHSPELLNKTDFLDIMDSILLAELKKFDSILIVPLGKAASAGLQYIKNKHGLDQVQILRGFPHPSGANGHRIKQFNENFESLRTQVLNYSISGND